MAMLTPLDSDQAGAGPTPHPEGRRGFMRGWAWGVTCGLCAGVCAMGTLVLLYQAAAAALQCPHG